MLQRCLDRTKPRCSISGAIYLDITCSRSLWLETNPQGALGDCVGKKYQGSKSTLARLMSFHYSLYEVIVRAIVRACVGVDRTYHSQ